VSVQIGDASPPFRELLLQYHGQKPPILEAPEALFAFDFLPQPSGMKDNISSLCIRLLDGQRNIHRAELVHNALLRGPWRHPNPYPDLCWGLPPCVSWSVTTIVLVGVCSAFGLLSEGVELIIGRLLDLKMHSEFSAAPGFRAQAFRV